MKDKHVRLVIEFDIDQESLDEKGLKAEDVFKHIVLSGSEMVDGFEISTNIPGFDAAYNFFLCDGEIVSKEFVQGRSIGDGLDEWREMVINEIQTNGVTIYGLADIEVNRIKDNNDIIDELAYKMNEYIACSDGNEYNALDKVFEKDFEDILLSARDEHFEVLSCVVRFPENNVSFNGIEIFLDGSKNMCCRFPDEEDIRPLCKDIRNIQEGNAFFFGNDGAIRTVPEASHQNMDEYDEPWIVYGDDGECYFEEDFGKELWDKTFEYLNGRYESVKLISKASTMTTKSTEVERKIIDLVASYEDIFKIPNSERVTEYFGEYGMHVVKRGKSISLELERKSLDAIGMLRHEFLSNNSLIYRENIVSRMCEYNLLENPFKKGIDAKISELKANVGERTNKKVSKKEMDR